MCLSECAIPTILFAYITHCERQQSGSYRDVSNRAAPVTNRRLDYDIGACFRPIERIGNQMPKLMWHEPRVPNRFRLPIRRLKDLVEVGKCWISKIAPKSQHVMSRHGEKSHQGRDTVSDQAADSLASGSRKHCGESQSRHVNGRRIFQG